MLCDKTLRLLQLALEEDLGSNGDITSCATIGEKSEGSVKVMARETLVCCGNEVASQLCQIMKSGVLYESKVPDGSTIREGDTIALLSGPVRSLLSLERTLLNFMQRLSGIASMTAQCVAIASRYSVQIKDTRKTTPGMRELEKYAVHIGGGRNHRFGLYDAYMIKNNHVDALNGDIREAIRLCKQGPNANAILNVEVRNKAELSVVCKEGVDCILLDNMTVEQLRNAVNLVRNEFNRPDIELEASGGITLDTLETYCQTGVDSISLGFLTHSVLSKDISLRWIK